MFLARPFIASSVYKWGGFVGGSDGKESACSAGHPGWILGQEDPLEEKTATHSSILAWRLPWTEESGGYSPWGRMHILFLLW